MSEVDPHGRSSDGSGSKQTAARVKLSLGVKPTLSTNDLHGSVGEKLQAIPDITAHSIAFDAGTDENRDTRAWPFERFVKCRVPGQLYL